MALKPETKTTLPQIAEGTHIAIPYQIIYLGNIKTEYMGEVKVLPKVRITFEFPTETAIFDGVEKPRVHTQEYTFSYGEKANLRKVVGAILGISKDSEFANILLEDILGKPCMAQIDHNEKGYANIVAVVSLPKGIKAPEQFNKNKVWDYDENYNEEFVNTLPQFIKDKIFSSKEWKEKHGELDVKVGGYEDEESIPF